MLRVPCARSPALVRCRVVSCAAEAQPLHTLLSRRASLALLPSLAASAAAAAEPEVLTVDRLVGGSSFGSIADALAAAPPGATVRVAAGYYPERLLFEKAVTSEASAGALVTVEHVSDLPYESTLVIECPGVVLRSLVVRHESPSVAANYAVVVRDGGALTLARCDVRSATGSGVGVEGGCVTATACAFHDCARHGAAVFGDLSGDAAGGTSVLEGCTFTANRGHGVLVRDGAAVELRGCGVERNGAAGVAAVDATLTMVGCTVKGNRGGSVDVERLVGLSLEANALDVPPNARKL